MLNPALTQLLWFAVVGTIAFAVDAGVLYAALPLFGYYGGRVVSYICATVVAWYLNRRLTFKPQHKATRTEWLRYGVLNLGGFAVNYGTYAACLYADPLFVSHPILAVAAGSMAGLFVNFAINKYIVFKPS